MNNFKKKWRGRTSGSNIPNVRVYLCSACQTWHDGKKPGQCRACGQMQFTKFDSKAEAKRYGELTLELNHGFISDLKLQEKIPLHAIRVLDNGNAEENKIGEYWADFSYMRDGQKIVEDVKGGADTDLSVWKRKHVKAEYGVDVQIIRR